MIKKHFLINVVLTTLVSYQDADNRKEKSYQYYSVKILPYSELILSPTHSQGYISDDFEYSIEKGSKTIFLATYSTGDSTFTDGARSETLIFEIDSTTNNFNIVDAGFSKNDGVYEKRCFCVDETANMPLNVIRGKAIGRKADPETWDLNIAVGMIDLKGTFKVDQTKVIDLKTGRAYN